MFLEELDPKKNFGEYLAYGTKDKPSFGNYGNIFENMNHPNADHYIGDKQMYKVLRYNLKIQFINLSITQFRPITCIT